MVYAALLEIERTLKTPNKVTKRKLLTIASLLLIATVALLFAYNAIEPPLPVPTQQTAFHTDTSQAVIPTLPSNPPSTEQLATPLQARTATLTNALHPTTTQTSIQTSIPTSSTQEPLVLYREDFEDGVANYWNSALWSVIDDGSGNNVYYTAHGGNTKAILPLSCCLTDDYAFEISYMLLEARGAGAIEFIFRRPSLNECPGYNVAVDYRQMRFFRSDINCDPSDTFDQRDVPQILNVWHTIRIEAKGSMFTIYQDEELLSQGSDTTYSSGAIAIITRFFGKVYIDNITVWSLNETE